MWLRTAAIAVGAVFLVAAVRTGDAYFWLAVAVILVGVLADAVVARRDDRGR
jgi:hypothetical protein